MRDIECQVADVDGSTLLNKLGETEHYHHNLRKGGPRLITRHLTGLLPATKKGPTIDDVSVEGLLMPNINE